MDPRPPIHVLQVGDMIVAGGQKFILASVTQFHDAPAKVEFKTPAELFVEPNKKGE